MSFRQVSFRQAIFRQVAFRQVTFRWVTFRQDGRVLLRGTGRQLATAAITPMAQITPMARITLSAQMISGVGRERARQRSTMRAVQQLLRYIFRTSALFCAFILLFALVNFVRSSILSGKVLACNC